MNKVLLSLAVIAGSVGYVTYENANPQPGNGVALNLAAIDSQTGSTTPASPTPAPASATQPAAPPMTGSVSAMAVASATATPAPQQSTQATTTVAAVAPVTVSTPAPVPSPRPRPANAPSAGNSVQVAQAGPRDGTYRGPQVDAYYGVVQVAAVMKSGRLQNIQILSYPSDRSRSQYISSVAIPMLEREAIQAQSANINIISGATLTSEAFIRSLYMALQPARG